MKKIIDLRTALDFKNVTFSGYKLSDVKKEFHKSLINNKIEQACNWSAELICSGHFSELWEIILFFFSKHVDLEKLFIACYLERKINKFKNKLVEHEFAMLELRNDQSIRELFCEIICVLCNLKQKHPFNEIKISEDDLSISTIRNKFKAPTTDYGNGILISGDPMELFPFFNELAYSISIEGMNQVNSCYWIEWIIEYDNLCKTKKEKNKCCPREFCNEVDSKYKNEVIWLIWETILRESTERNKSQQMVIESLFNLFTSNYSTSCLKTRKYLIYLAVSTLCEKVLIQTKLSDDRLDAIIHLTVNNINLIYNNIKLNEKNNDLTGISGGNINAAKSLQKLHILKSFESNIYN